MFDPIRSASATTARANGSAASRQYSPLLIRSFNPAAASNFAAALSGRSRRRNDRNPAAAKGIAPRAMAIQPRGQCKSQERDTATTMA
jgi:hypothetical protein